MFKKRTVVAKIAYVTAFCLLSQTVAWAGVESEPALAVWSDNSVTGGAAGAIRQEDRSGFDIPESIAAGFLKAAENDSCILYVNPESLAVQLFDKESGELLSSFLNSGEGMNRIWKGFMNSGITMEYMGQQGKPTRVPLDGAKAEVEYQKLPDGFSARIAFRQGIELTMKVQLDGRTLVVEVPADTIRETGDLKLQNLYVYPFLGATRGTEVPGYLLIPDGCGALIRTDRESLATAPYRKRVYGADAAVSPSGLPTRKAPRLPEEQILMPVFGMASLEGQYGYAATVESGSAYAEIQAYAGGVGVPCNFVTMKYLYRETYTQPQGQSGAGAVLNQKDRNQMDLRVRYTLLTGEQADYNGMASVWREYYRERGMGALAVTEQDGGSIPMHVEILASEQTEGLFGKRTLVMTSLSEAETILSSLLQEGITTLRPVIRGFEKTGASAAAPMGLRLEPKVGSKNDWRKFTESWKDQGVSVGLYGDFNKGYAGVKGYRTGKDRAQAMSQALLKSYDTAACSYLSPVYAAKRLDETGKKAKELGVSFLAVDTMGNTLYSDWSKHTPVTREEAIELYAKSGAGELARSGYGLADYMWGSAAEIYDLPEDSSGYLIFTDTVPVLQMVLKGSIPYYGPAVNFQSDPVRDTLRMAEYGEYPSVFFTWRDPLALADTPSSWLYTSRYEVWKEPAVRQYHQLNDILSHTAGKTITKHQVLAKGVVRVEYSGGGAVAVNYNEEPYQSGGLRLEGESAVWMEDGKGA